MSRRRRSDVWAERIEQLLSETPPKGWHGALAEWLEENYVRELDRDATTIRKRRQRERDVSRDCPGETAA